MKYIKLGLDEEAHKLAKSSGGEMFEVLISPTDDDHAVSLIFTQRFSVGNFWSPQCKR